MNMNINIEKDINSYLEYLERLVNGADDSKLTSDMKSKLNEKISLFKITGYCYIYDFLYKENSYEKYSLDYELYLLFEEMSKFIFNVKTYKNWIL
jgi:hypothetical protein